MAEEKIDMAEEKAEKADKKKAKTLSPEEEELELVKANEAHMQKRVKIKLYRDKTHTEQVYVSVGNYSALITRGEEVLVPRFAAEVINNSLNQDADTAIMIQELEDKS